MGTRAPGFDSSRPFCHFPVRREDWILEIIGLHIQARIASHRN